MNIKLAVPLGDDEERRLKILRESTLLDSSTADPNFDRYTSLCKRLFNVINQTLQYSSQSKLILFKGAYFPYIISGCRSPMVQIK